MKHQEFAVTSRWIVFSFLFFFLYLSGFIQASESVSTQERRVVEADDKNAAVANQIVEEKIVAPQAISQRSPTNEPSEWGIAKQIDEHTWTMRVGEDNRMATAQEILAALNAYRERHGRGALIWDGTLASYASERAAFFTMQGTLDGHAGFQDYLDNQNGFEKLGFRSVGENSSYGYQLAGVHLIEWVYAGDEPHDKNQLDSQWKYVGIGVNGTATDLIFGGERL